MLYPVWLNPGDNSWQMTAATLVGLMSIPGLVVLYGGVMQKRWSVNSMMLAFVAFALILLMWVLYGYKMGFGHPMHIFGQKDDSFFGNFLGKPGPVLDHTAEQGQATIPNLGDAGVLDFPQSSLVYFQFVFAAITPILMLGAILGRVNFKAWIPFVLLWLTCIYTVNAFLIWGGGWFAQHGAVDFSGGYVIHLAAGVSGFVAAWVIGPRLARDREIDAPNNLAMVALGAGLLWLGWNGFNGGDPYNAGADASAAVLNTNLAAAVAFLVWVTCDYATNRKPSLLGSVNGMIVGLVAITPAAGFVNGYGAIIIGAVASVIVYVAYNYLARVRPFRNVQRHPGRDLHPRLRGPPRRSADRPAGRLRDGDRPGDLGVRRAAPPEVAGVRRPLGDRLLRRRHVHPAPPGGSVHPPADERGGHGGRRRGRPRARGLPGRHPVARIPVGRLRGALRGRRVARPLAAAP